MELNVVCLVGHRSSFSISTLENFYFYSRKIWFFYFSFYSRDQNLKFLFLLSNLFFWLSSMPEPKSTFLLKRGCRIRFYWEDASAIQAKMHQQSRIVRENTNSAQLGEKTSILRSRGASEKNIQIKSTFQKRESIPLTRILMLMFSNFDNSVSQLFSHVACFRSCHYKWQTCWIEVVHFCCWKLCL